ncbi:HlyD family secretion protein [Neorhodopirellula pilleata]|nr:HlyD family efflux transporter periplasmic adaptor subunit [Neorhodopirellula pilleata]
MATTTKPEDAAVVQSPISDQPAITPRRRGTMILPEAYDERAMPSLKLTRSSRRARRIGRILTFMIVIGSFLVVFAPWQQSVRGTGSVIAYTPRDRTQTIESPTKGRIVSWGDNIFENAHVTEGQIIAEIRDLDESYAERLLSQLEAARSQADQVQNVVEASQRNLVNAKAMAETIRAQVQTYRSVKDQTVAAAEAGVEAARAKIASQEQKLAEVQATLSQAATDYERQKTLFDERIASQLKFQQAEQKFNEAKAKVAQAEADVMAAQSALAEKQRDRDAKEQKAQADIEYATSTLNKAEGDVAKSESEIAKAMSDLQKSKTEVFKAETALARQDNQTIRAPFDGFLTQIMPNQGSAVLKEGDPICVIVPDTSDRAVQVWLDGNDAPLVTPGRHVRLQFEGWPAVQFAGWPSVAVGTFGGEVVSIDATDDGKGKFRVLVQAEEDGDWPDERFLRQGVRANGWVLLERVPLWFEIWRNMNGFPPMLEEEAKYDNKAKPPKVKL